MHWGSGHKCPRAKTGDTETNEKVKVTCPTCVKYVARTGDGPESLKRLFRF